ncbi:2-oxoglutarate (2OG) and Fe(II)-dependent oxygenase superfamily protein [Tanacetum coccineum]|uniref:2-oxoglutarate (2OG) and Fe(II)-dependent oxygenase superfamily protein n=1 Tax=Tanacetum coccineum TaxID=301880 RepID=A0ABQ5E700_9ASTR
MEEGRNTTINYLSLVTFTAYGGFGTDSYVRGYKGVWCGILKANYAINDIDPSLAVSFKLKVSNGYGISFWKDMWYHRGSRIMDLFSRLFVLDSFPECSVKDRWGLVNGSWVGLWSWRYPPRGRALYDLASLISLIGNLVLERLFYINSLGLHHVWNYWIPRKVNICVWRASIDRLSTRLNLVNRGVSIDSAVCPFCEACRESVNHCLLICPKPVQGFYKRMVVSAIMEVTTYGSMLDAGLRSFKYPFPSFSVSRPTRTEALRKLPPSPHLPHHIPPYTNLNSTLSSTLHSISELGYFQLTDHPIPPQLAHSAQSDSLSIFKEKKHHFTKNWPIGFNNSNEDDSTESLFLDSESLSDSSDEFSLSSLHGFMHAMEKVGLSVVEGLTCAMGLQVKDGVCTTSLLWLGDGEGAAGDDHQMLGSGSGKFYPYLVGLHYMFTSGRSCGLITDSGLVSVKTQVDSILVTLGDIAQVWSNGKLKKVRGKPTISMEEGNNSSSLSMSLLVTLPLESTVSPLLPRVISNHDDTDHNDNQNQDDQNEPLESMFSSFSFEDYAWRVYHERIHLKDPLDRHRIQT